MDLLANENYSVQSFWDDFFDVSTSKNMALDIIQNKDEFIVKVNLPGYQKKDVKVNVKNNQLTIKAECKEEKKTDDQKIHRSERFIGKIMRTITLPDGYSNDNITAKMENGVLTLKIKKVENNTINNIIIE